MPQLHDSRSRHSTPTQPSATTGGCDRIFGLETEYGLSVSGASRPLDISQVAMTMFQPVVQRERSTNTYLDNGSRLYLDVGSHPEYATAEARTPFDAMLADAAGESLMRTMAIETQARLRAQAGERATIHLFKNNADSAGHSYGCHENYLVRRYVDLRAIQTQLLPFLITRQIYTGAGRFDGDHWTYTQRARFVDETVSSATTRSRPMINTRDEPHADPESFRRLHVIIGDSNRSQWATMVKCATTHLVLGSMEHAARTGVPSGLECLEMADPVQANLEVNEHGPDAMIDLADGTRMSALEMQRLAWRVIERFAHSHAHELDASLQGDPVWTPHSVLDAWRWVLDRLEAHDIDALAQVVDWACKRRFFARLEERGPVGPMRIAQLDLDYHDVANGTLYEAMVRHGLMRVYADPQQVAHAVHTPPERTRAVLRGRFVQRAQQAGVRHVCDWTQVQVLEPEKRTAQMLDPFDSEGTPEYHALMASLA